MATCVESTVGVRPVRRDLPGFVSVMLLISGSALFVVHRARRRGPQRMESERPLA